MLYGKTIDHVLEQTVVLSDGSIAHFREIPRDEVPAGDIAGGRVLPRRCFVSRASTRDEIDRRYPKVLRRVGGYNLDEFTDRRQAGESGEDHGGLGRHAGRGARSQAAAGPVAESAKP